MTEPTERRLHYIAIATAGALLLAIAYPLFTGEVYTESDFGHFHMPFKYFYAQCLANGSDFIWSPQEFNGFYLHGEGQLNLYHPLNLISYSLLPFDAAFTLELVRNYVFLLLGTYLFARRWAMPPYAAVFAASRFAFSSVNLLHFMHLNVVAIVAHMPFALLAIDIAMRSQEPRRVALATVAIAFITASQLLFGHPQFAWFSLFAEGTYVAYLLKQVGGARRLPWLAIAQVLGFLLASIALLPQWESLAGSFRAAPDSKFAFSMSLHPMRLTQFFAPFIFAERTTDYWAATELVIYNGALSPLFLVWLWIRRRELGDLTPRVVVLVAFATLMLIVSLGNYGLLYLAVAKIPVVGLFRGPGRYMVLFQFATALAAGLVAIDLLRVATAREPLPWRRLWPLGLPMLAGVLVLIGWGIAKQLVPDVRIVRLLAGPLHLAAGPALLFVATALVLAAARGKRAALGAIMLFAVVDQALFGLSYMWREPRMSHEEFVAQLDVPVWAEQNRAHYFPPATTMRGVKLADGYVAMTPRKLLHTKLYPGIGSDSHTITAALRASGVGMAYKQVVVDPLPWARLVPHTVEIVALNPQMASIDLRTTALVQEKIGLPPGEPGQVKVLSRLPGDLALETHAASRQLLVLSESYHRGWRGQIDGEACEVIRVYHDFMGCVVPAGQHQVPSWPQRDVVYLLPLPRMLRRRIDPHSDDVRMTFRCLNKCLNTGSRPWVS